jgi:hypothetical protein
MFKRLLAQESAESRSVAVERIRSYIDFYIDHFRDPFVVKNGHKLELFVSSLPAIISSLKERDARRVSTSEVSNSDFELIEAARKRVEE